MKVLDSNTIEFEGCRFKRFNSSLWQRAIIAGAVNFRAGPGTDSKVIRKLKKDQEDYIILDKGDDWVKIRVDWEEGYVHKRFIEDFRESSH